MSVRHTKIRVISLVFVQIYTQSKSPVPPKGEKTKTQRSWENFYKARTLKYNGYNRSRSSIKMSTELTLIELPYSEDGAQLFSKFQALPWSIYLDSCHPYCQQGRFDIISAYPFTTLKSNGNISIVQSKGQQYTSSADPLLLLKEELTRYTHSNFHYPFYGGALGYFSYDLARQITNLPELAANTTTIPTMAIGLYDWAIVTDHHSKQTVLLSTHQHNTTHKTINKVQQLLRDEAPDTESFTLTTPWRKNMSKSQYAQAFKQIQQFIQAGDCYQVNLTQCFSAQFTGSLWSAYSHLRTMNPAPHAAYLNFPDTNIASLSPERFLHVKQNKVTTQPIKGTRPRSSDRHLDQQLQQELLANKKERAENLMIVDLLRNDLAKTCIPGSIKVPKLFGLESFANVHHLVSTVTGELRNHKHSLDLLRGCFPGGSITGAPKLRAMQIIESLESQRRHVYCGAIGYIDFNGNMDTNISIRTLTAHNNSLYCAAGGGIVVDSKLAAEYQETLTKVECIMQILASIGSAKIQRFQP